MKQYLYDTMPWKSVEQLDMCMEQCIKAVANVDKSVNTVIYIEIIT